MAEQKVITREEATAQILAAKKQRGLTFEEIAKAVGRHKVWVTAALMGQATMSKEEAERAVSVLGLGEGEASAVAATLQEPPMNVTGASYERIVGQYRPSRSSYLPIP
jgi:cyanate lyase